MYFPYVLLGSKEGPGVSFKKLNLEKSAYSNLFIRKLRKLNSIFLLFNILYIINTNFLQPL